MVWSGRGQNGTERKRVEWYGVKAGGMVQSGKEMEWYGVEGDGMVRSGKETEWHIKE